MKDDAKEKYGRRFGRPDTERIGQFAEMGYLVGQEYTGTIRDVNIRDPKKRQMFPGGPKIKAGLQDCYFDKDFKRIFIGEGINWRGQEEPKSTSRKYPRSFFPPHYPLKLNYRGEPYGTFSGVIPAFSPRENPKDPYRLPKRGVYTSVGKKGGPGVYDITINKFPEWNECKYDPADTTETVKKRRALPFYGARFPNYFDSNPFKPDTVVPPNYKMVPKAWKKHTSFKYSGGAGDYLNKFPKFMPDKYYDPMQRDKVLSERYKSDEKPFRHLRPFCPPPCCRELETLSVMARNVKISTNERTWKQMKPITFKRRFHKI